MKRNHVIQSLVAIALLIIGGIVGYTAGAQATIASIPRTNSQIIADAKNTPTGVNNGTLVTVSNPDVFIEEPGGTYTNRCSVEYGGELTKISNLPDNYEETAKSVHRFRSFESEQDRIILMHYRAPATPTGRVLADTPVCEDDVYLSGPEWTFWDAKESAKK